MPNIIVIKRDSKGEINIYVGGKPTTKFLGQDIADMDEVKKNFATIQQKNPEIEEIHLGAFVAGDEHGKIGNPILDQKTRQIVGSNIWGRVKLKDKDVSDNWVFLGSDRWDQSLGASLAQIGTRAIINDKIISMLKNEAQTGHKQQMLKGTKTLENKMTQGECAPVALKATEMNR